MASETGHSRQFLLTVHLLQSEGDAEVGLGREGWGEADSLRLGGEDRGRWLLVDLRTAVSGVGCDPFSSLVLWVPVGSHRTAGGSWRCAPWTRTAAGYSEVPLPAHLCCHEPFR